MILEILNAEVHLRLSRPFRDEDRQKKIQTSMLMIYYDRTGVVVLVVSVGLNFVAQVRTNHDQRKRTAGSLSSSFAISMTLVEFLMSVEVENKCHL